MVTALRKGRRSGWIIPLAASGHKGSKRVTRSKCQATRCAAWRVVQRIAPEGCRRAVFRSTIGLLHPAVEAGVGGG